MCHGVIRTGQVQWDAAEEARWRQDAMPELHNNDALWAYTLRASEEYQMLDRCRLNDETLYRLLAMGIFDWEKPDVLMNQVLQAVRLGTATSTRWVGQGHKLESLGAKGDVPSCYMLSTL